MTSKPKGTSRWGSLLSGAVANLESRLDNILADETTIAQRNAIVYPSQQSATTERPTRPKEPTSANESRGSSISRTHTPFSDRPPRLGLSEPGRQSPSIRADSETRQPAPATFDSTDSLPTEHPEPSEQPSDADKHEPTHANPPLADPQLRAHPSTPQLDSSAANTPDRLSLDNGEPSIPTDLAIPTSQDPSQADTNIATLTSEQYQSQIAELRSEKEAADTRHQEEAQSNLEKIDALESKLGYLTKEAAESARQAQAQAPPDSLEKKLAAKDEQIALLMEEGQKLSKAEVAQSGLAKKLRLKISEDSKNIAELKGKLFVANELSEKVKRLETAQREASIKISRIPRLERELENLKLVRDEKEAELQALRVRADSESKRADEAAKKSNEAALEVERKRIQSLEDDLSNARLEKQLADERAKKELKEAQEELQRERQRGKTEAEGLRNEISALESRLETLRSRTEEASSDTTNDAQAKLLRQVETLQSQYSLARENWQGIESSLQARITAVEKERADTARQEHETRKKAREANSTARHLQESLDETTRKCQVLEQDLSQRQAHADRLESRIQGFERDVKAAHDKLEQERRASETTFARRLEEEKAKWRQEMGSFPGADLLPAASNESSVPALRRSSTLELPGLLPRRALSRNMSTELSIPITDRPTSRRSSHKPSRPFEIGSPDPESGRSTPFLNGSTIPETPSIADNDADDMLETSSSPHRTVNDMISGSTAAAGPSVQLVERMSAKVRKLESEKAASRDELARITAQREEARQEVVALMREVEQKRAVDAKIAALEKDMAKVGERYHTTLEMLGEKSERVEELEADVADLKKIYRELVESTIK